MVYVQTASELRAALSALSGGERYYLDTEFERNGPVGRLCLVQVSRGADVFVVDAMKVSVRPLVEAIARPECEWVFHDGGQDFAYLSEAAGFEPRVRFFDTQVAWGLLGPEYPVSLAYLHYHLLGMRSAKEHQAGDWSSRPLSPEQIEYAASDVEHLRPLREKLDERLGERRDLARELSAETILPMPPEPLTLDGFRNAWQLDAPGQAGLKFLIEWYNALPPEERKFAPHPKAILSIAKMLPESGAELAKIRGVAPGWARRHGDALTGRLLRATAAVTNDGFVPLVPPPYDTFERIVASGWIRHAASQVSAALGIAPSLAFPERVTARMTEAVVSGGKSAAAGALEGWRARLLADAVRRFA